MACGERLLWPIKLLSEEEALMILEMESLGDNLGIELCFSKIGCGSEGSELSFYNSSIVIS